MSLCVFSAFGYFYAAAFLSAFLSLRMIKTEVWAGNKVALRTSASGRSESIIAVFTGFAILGFALLIANYAIGRFTQKSLVQRLLNSVGQKPLLLA